MDANADAAVSPAAAAAPPRRDVEELTAQLAMARSIGEEAQRRAAEARGQVSVLHATAASLHLV